MPKKSDASRPSKAQRKKWGASDKDKVEHFERDIFIEDELLNTIKAEVPKMKMITPSIISQKYNLRISLVKDILKELIEQKLIKQVITTNRLKVFIPA